MLCPYVFSSPMPNDADAIPLSAFALLSTLRTAVEVRHAIAERRAGRDPSEQEAAQDARAYLRETAPELQGLVTRLRVSLVIGRDEDAGLVQAFEDRLVLACLARELHVVHQRLLSLYPDVTEDLAEAARRRQHEAEALAAASGEGFDGVLAGWLDRAAALCEGLVEAAAEAN